MANWFYLAGQFTARLLMILFVVPIVGLILGWQVIWLMYKGRLKLPLTQAIAEWFMILAELAHNILIGKLASSERKDRGK